MFNFDTIATISVFLAFLAEFAYIFLHSSDKDLLKDLKANIIIGALLLLTGALVRGIELGFFSLLYRVSVFKPRPSILLWIAAFVCCDLIYYLYHWLGHRTRLFWAAHVTHHSSVHFNLSTAIRINSFHVLYRFIFWSPLCFLGFSPLMVMFIESLTNLLNFVVHTEKVGKLGVLDKVFNTPSNHRVHHASNPEYIDRNLGGIFMIFDHLFGTYAKETVPPVYGITHNIDSYNPYEIITHEYRRLATELPKLKKLSHRVRYLFSRPR